MLNQMESTSKHLTTVQTNYKEGGLRRNTWSVHNNMRSRQEQHPDMNSLWAKSPADIISKILVLDDQAANNEAMRHFCESTGLIGITPSRRGQYAALAILESEVDFGGIFIYEKFLETPFDTFALVAKIRELRPELPIFLRRAKGNGMAGLDFTVASMFIQSYTLDEFDTLTQGLESSIFRRLYPNELAKGIREVTQKSIAAMFPNCEVHSEIPYLASDRIIHGEFFTLIGIDSEWCRGYMTIQGPEKPLLEMMALSNPKAEIGFRELNQHIGEVTNLVWGAFKNRYVANSETRTSIQVPIIVSPQHRFISFGSDDPQLCFKYFITCEDRHGEIKEAWVYQRFVFNLAWSPQDFKINPESERANNTGHLEIF